VEHKEILLLLLFQIKEVMKTALVTVAAMLNLTMKSTPKKSLQLNSEVKAQTISFIHPSSRNSTAVDVLVSLFGMPASPQFASI
jgi:hypothetical protein